MNERVQWDEYIALLDIELAHLRNQRDASEPGTDLHRMTQDECNVVHYQLRAAKAARPELDRLWRQLRTEQNGVAQYRRSARDDAAAWTRTAVVAGLLGSAALLLWALVDGPWWLLGISIVAVMACVGSVVGAVTAHRDTPSTGRTVQLSARIEALRQACEMCDSAEGLDHVMSILHPPVDTLPTRIF